MAEACVPCQTSRADSVLVDLGVSALPFPGPDSPRGAFHRGAENAGCLSKGKLPFSSCSSLLQVL